MENSITSSIVGGLGNQLFIIFASISYGLNHIKPVSFLNTKTVCDGKFRTYWDNFLIDLKPLLKQNIKSLIQYKEPYFHYCEFPKFNKSVCLNGYFQSEKYFKNKYNEIMSLIKLRSQQEVIKAKHKYDYENSISLHFRIGDYKNITDYHPLMPYEYYFNCIKHMMTNTCITNILYFCQAEDNTQVSEIIKKLMNECKTINFIKVQDNIPDWEQLLIMSCCQHNIIANSTFSWWGAYFNSNVNKIVCYPSTWFGSSAKYETMDLCPDEWVRISICI